MLKAWKEFSSDTLIWRSSFRWSQCLVCSGGSADRSLSVAVAVREFVPAAFCDQLLQCDLVAAVLPLPLLAWYHLVSPLCLTYTTCSAAVKFGEKPYCFLRLDEIEIWTWELLSFLYFHRQFVFVASLAEINYYSSNWLTNLPNRNTLIKVENKTGV